MFSNISATVYSPSKLTGDGATNLDKLALICKLRIVYANGRYGSERIGRKRGFGIVFVLRVVYVC